MRPKAKIIKLGFFMGGFLLICALLIGIFLPRISPSDKEAEGIFSLAKPAFAQDAEVSFLAEEAGIAAYISLGRRLTPAKAKTAFRIIEKETERYIVGSVPISDSVQDDVYCFIHEDGWIVVYYLKEEPTSKICGGREKRYWNSRQNVLEDTLIKISGTLGIPFTGAKYYHFQYPLANKLMKIWGRNFRVKIPSEFRVFETSYADKYGDQWSGETLSPGKFYEIGGDQALFLVYYEP